MKRVIIIGSGVSGITCAKYLQKAFKPEELEVLILEARDRIGGRTFTKRFENYSVDLGASWLEGSNTNPLVELCDEYNVKYSIPNDEEELSITFDYDGKKIDEKLKEIMKNKFDEIFKKVLEKKEKDLSLEESFQNVFKENKIEFQDQEKRIFQSSINFIQGYNGANLNELSVLNYSMDNGFEGREVFSIDGIGTLMEKHSIGLNIKLNQFVKKIDYSKDKIQIFTKSDKFDCDYVVCTVPLGCLKKETIQFIPSLPDYKKDIISRVGYGLLDKFLLEFPFKFWDDFSWFQYLPKDKETFTAFLNLGYYHKNAPVLICFLNSKFAKLMEEKSDEEIINELMKVLKIIFGENIPNPKNHIFTRWSNDPFSYGSYTFNGVNNSSKDYDDLGNPIDNKLFFAGEATIARGNSFVNGAYLSGLRDAQRIEKILK